MKRIAFNQRVTLILVLVGAGMFMLWLFYRSYPAERRQSVQEVKKQQKCSGNTVLDVSTEGGGMVAPVGEMVDFRMYENGCLEYDIYPPNESSTSQGNAEIVRKQSQLTPKDVSDLIGLTQQADFLSAKAKYPVLHPHTDDWWVTTIKFIAHGREKKVVAVNFWDMLSYPEDRVKYPPSMVKLLERTRELQKEARRKDS